MRHRIEAGMHDFVVHGEHENRMEVPLERRFNASPDLQLTCRPCFAVTHSLPIRAMACRRWRCPLASARRRVGDEAIFVLVLDVLEHVERIDRVELAGDGACEHVVHESLERPMRIHPLLHVGDEHRIEVSGRHLADRLLDDPRAERIGASDLEHVSRPCSIFATNL